MAARRKPIDQHLIHGTFRADRHADRAAVAPPPGRPTAPSWLSEAAVVEFDLLVDLLERVGRESPAYAIPLALIADAVVDFYKAAREAEGLPLVIEDANGGVKANPIHRVKAGAWQRVISGCREFGLSPVSVEKVASTTPTPTKPRAVSDFKLTH